MYINCTQASTLYVFCCSPLLIEQCQPVCTQGCRTDYGTCSEPDVCACHFGRVGPSCETECECHGHSECADDSEAGRRDCRHCRNNTQVGGMNACSRASAAVALLSVLTQRCL